MVQKSDNVPKQKIELLFNLEGFVHGGSVIRLLRREEQSPERAALDSLLANWHLRVRSAVRPDQGSFSGQPGSFCQRILILKEQKQANLKQFLMKQLLPDDFITKLQNVCSAQMALSWKSNLSIITTLATLYFGVIF